jgi:hypothetical protein
MNATENERLRRIASLDDEIELLQAETAGRNKQESERFGLATKQGQEQRGLFGDELDKTKTKQSFQTLKLLQSQYDEMFSKVKTQAEGVFDAIFLRGKKGFQGLLDYIKGTFITGLKDLFGNVVATLFTGSRPGGGSTAQGGLFGGIAQLFSGGRQGGGGGILGGLRSLFGGGGGQGGPGGVFGGGVGPGGVFSLAGGGARGGFERAFQAYSYGVEIGFARRVGTSGAVALFWLVVGNAGHRMANDEIDPGEVHNSNGPAPGFLRSRQGYGSPD